MTPSLLLRPVLACAAAASLSACGMIDSDPHRFEAMAESVAAIPLDGEAGAATARTQAETGLRPALRVQVMDPHALWDARDGGLGRMAGDPAPRLAAMAPSTAEAVVQTVSARLDSAAAKAGLRPAQPQRPKAPSGANAALVQIGAYSSEAAARAAWARLDLDDLTPVFEAVEVDGRRLTRLKVRAPASGAAAVCAAAGIDDPWCHRTA